MDLPAPTLPAKTRTFRSLAGVATPESPGSSTKRVQSTGKESPRGAPNGSGSEWTSSWTNMSVIAELLTSAGSAQCGRLGRRGGKVVQAWGECSRSSSGEGCCEVPAPTWSDSAGGAWRDRIATIALSKLHPTVGTVKRGRSLGV